LADFTGTCPVAEWRGLFTLGGPGHLDRASKDALEPGIGFEDHAVGCVIAVVVAVGIRVALEWNQDAVRTEIRAGVEDVRPRPDVLKSGTGRKFATGQRTHERLDAGRTVGSDLSWIAGLAIIEARWDDDLSVVGRIVRHQHEDLTEIVLAGDLLAGAVHRAETGKKDRQQDDDDPDHRKDLDDRHASLILVCSHATLRSASCHSFDEPTIPVREKNTPSGR
jgi:hypothetical protein